MLSGPLDDHVLVNYVDSHCHIDRLQTNFGVLGTQDVITALYAKVNNDRYEGCVSNLVDPWLWDSALHSSILKDPRVHVTVGLHPKHHSRMGATNKERSRKNADITNCGRIRGDRFRLP